MMPCPRCLAHETRQDHQGRDGETVVWRILHCCACSFSWRDCEPPSAIDPAVRDPDFRIDPGAPERFPVVLPPGRR